MTLWKYLQLVSAFKTSSSGSLPPSVPLSSKKEQRFYESKKPVTSSVRAKPDWFVSG